MADAVADFVIDGCMVGRQHLITEYELMVESARQPALQESTARWLRSLRAQMVEVMTALESADPEIDARLPHVVVSGLEVDSLADRPDSPGRGVDPPLVQHAARRLLIVIDKRTAPPVQSQLWSTPGRL